MPPPKTYAWYNPYYNSGAERYRHHLHDLYGRRIDSEQDFRERLNSVKARPDIFLIWCFCEERAGLVSLCRENGINVAFWEDGFFPHYDSVHFDPLGFCWESSLPRMVFRQCTDRQRACAQEARRAWLEKPRGSLPAGIRKPYALWPLQLIGDKVNEWDLALKDWTPLIRHFRARLPQHFQLVVKPHPLSEPKDIVGIEALSKELTNTLLLPTGANLHFLLHECNAVAGANSSVLYEARLMHFKPTFAYGRSWFTNHEELFLPLRVNFPRPLPRLDWVENPAGMHSAYLYDYADWFLAQLLARQLHREPAEKDPVGFTEILCHMSQQSYMENGDSIFER